MRRPESVSTLKKLLRPLLVTIGAVGLTLLFFLVLPLMQSISKPLDSDTMVRSIDTANLPPPPPPPEPEPEKKQQPDDKPPELQPDQAPLDLSQLELALNPGVSGGLLGGDFGVKLSTLAGAAGVGDVDALFSLADLDQKPRVIYQPGPTLDATLRKKLPATVNIVFIVDQHGRVESPLVQTSTDPAFERAALAAVKQWRFEPGKRNGKEVRFRMRQPFTFPAGK